MTFVIGLGNPEDKYQSTRHNIGFMVLEALASNLNAKSKINHCLTESRQNRKRLKQTSNSKFSNSKRLSSQILKAGSIVLVKPLTYMNESGKAVKAVWDFYTNKEMSLEDSTYNSLYIVHDDLDIVLGEYKIQFGKGPKIHHGLQSIYNHLGTDQFWHVRIGIDGRGGDRSMPGSKYVLQKFSKLEEIEINRVVSSVVGELQDKLEI